MGNTIQYEGKTKKQLISEIKELRFQLEILQNAEKFHETEANYQTAFELCADAIFWADVNTELIVNCNRAAEQMIGYPREKLIGQHRAMLHPPEGKEFYAGHFRRHKERGSAEESETEVISSSGKRIPVLISATRLKLGNQEVLQGIFRDITDLKRTEEKLRHLSSAVEQSPASIVITNRAGEIEYVNPKFMEVTGYTQTEVLGQNPRVLKSGDQGPEFYQSLWETISAGREWRGEFHNKDKQGNLYWESASISPIRNLYGHITHFLAIKEDITDRKRFEADLLETNRRLEEATARANDMAAQAAMANAAKSEFLSNMSHEIRTPMNGVIGMTDLLLDTGLNDDQRKYAEMVRGSGKSLLAILNDILDFSKIEAGKLEIETIDFDLRATLEDVAAMMALRAQNKGLELICGIAPDVPTYLRGDPGRLRQILNNLAGNAIKFTDKGEIAVRVSLVLETDDDALIRFSIKDTGIGISGNKKSFLFQKFNQLDASTTRKYGGTGLGLAISKQLTELMGGDIGCESQEGLGSEFWFTAPFPRQRAGGTEIPMPTEINGTNILIVDDNATNREILMAQFAAWGALPKEVPDGHSALQALHQAGNAGNPFQIAILDLQMPGMDGVTLGQAIKTDDLLKDTKLIMMTSFGQRGDARQMEQLGFSAYLTKPIRLSDLFVCLSSVLTGTPIPHQEKAIVTRHTIREIRRGMCRILLAEDNVTNQQVAIGILKKLGFSADIVTNGAEAIEALATVPYDLVLMDVQMPVMDGVQATRLIRNPESACLNHAVPIIAMTAHAREGDRNRFLSAGMDDYISKPVSPQALSYALDKWLSREATAPIKMMPAVHEDTASSHSQESEAPVFDRAGMMARLMDNEELAFKIIQVFLDDLPKQVDALRGYIESNDAKRIELQAHAIVGASANIGGEALRGVALKMEKAARAGEMNAVKVGMSEIENQFQALKGALSDFTDT